MRPDDINFERCCQCGDLTGRAGAHDDSLYTGNHGPFCESCYEPIAELEAQLAEAREDAERYRWIRENYEWRRYGNLPDEDSYAFVGCRFSYLANFECKPMLDYNIDQMRKALAGQGGEG